MLRVVLLAIRGFKEDACMLRASSLTFYTMLSIVPVAAMAFGIAKGFGYQKVLEEQLFRKLSRGRKKLSQQVVVFAQSLLETTKGGVIAGFGLVLLFWAVVKVSEQYRAFLQQYMGCAATALHRPQVQRLSLSHADQPSAGHFAEQRGGFYYHPCQPDCSENRFVSIISVR